MSQFSVVYYGLVYWDVFGFGSDVCKMLGLLDDCNIVFVLWVWVEGLWDWGLVVSLFNSFLLLQGLEILSLCVECYIENVMVLVIWLQDYFVIVYVSYLGLVSDFYNDVVKKYLIGCGMGCMLMFFFNGGYDDVVCFIDSFKLVSYFVNVGDVKMLVIYFVFMIY